MTARPDVALLLGRFGSGGVERVACHLANGFAAAGLLVEIWVAEDDGPTRGLVATEVTIRVVGRGRGPRGLRLLAAIPAIARALRERRPRVLLSPGNHTHVAASLALAGSGAADVAFVAKITNPILKDRHGALRRAATRAFYRRAFARARLVLVLSRKAEAGVAEIDPALPARTRFVHNPYVEASMLRPSADADAPEDPPLIVSVGRLSVQKNQSMLLRAAASLRDRPWRIALLGLGPEEERLRAEAAALGIADRVEFKGFVADPTPFYRRAALLALPSRWEDLPATAVEAAACGCPMLATACSQALTDFLDGIGAPPPTPVDDEAAFAEALARLLDHPPLRTRTASVAAYSIANGVREHLDALIEAADLRPLQSR